MIEACARHPVYALHSDQLQGALITGGIMISYWLDFAFSFLDPDPVAWRFPIAFQIFFALIIVVFILELPESPRWLILRGRWHRCY